MEKEQEKDREWNIDEKDRKKSGKKLESGTQRVGGKMEREWEAREWNIASGKMEKEKKEARERNVESWRTDGKRVGEI